MMKLFCDKCDSLMTEDDSKEVSVLIEFPDRVNHVSEKFTFVSEKFTLRRAEGSAGKGADLCRWCIIGAIARLGKKEALGAFDKELAAATQRVLEGSKYPALDPYANGRSMVAAKEGEKK